MSKHHNYNQVPVRLPIKQLQINFQWTDDSGQAGKLFDNVQQFADFLKANPDLGNAAGYVPRKNEPIDFMSLLAICENTFRSFFNEHTKYMSTSNTMQLNSFFKADRTVYSLSGEARNTLVIESAQVSIQYTRDQGQIIFRLKG